MFEFKSDNPEDFIDELESLTEKGLLYKETDASGKERYTLTEYGKMIRSLQKQNQEAN